MPSNKFDVQQKLLIATFNELASSYRNKFTSDTNEEVKIKSLVESWEVNKGSTILEVGGGTGDLSPYLLRKLGAHGKLVFLDISPKMVETARKKLAQYKNVQFVCEDIHTLETPYLFDNIIVFNTFPHFINKEIALANIFRLLKDSASLVISHNNSRWSIVGHHKRKDMYSCVSEFPEDSVVYKTLVNIGYKVEIFENNEGYDYYLVISRKPTSKI